MNPQPTGTLWLVRHGQSTWNVLGRAQGHADDAQLTAHGRRQADEVAERLAEHPIGAIYASDLRRVAQTAAPLARRLGLPVHPDERLRERNLGVLEGGALSALVPAVSGIDGERVVDADAHPDAGETIRQFRARADAFLASLAADIDHDDRGDVVVVTHGGTLRMLRACLDAVPAEAIAWVPVHNCAVVTRPLARVAAPAGAVDKTAPREDR